MIIVSTLWYDKNTFAITNGITDSSATLVPLYIASCVAYAATPGCTTWQSDGGGSYSAKVNLVYGNISNDSPPFFSPEHWQYRIDDLMADGIAAYYYSYKAINYYESLGLTTLNPVSVNVGVVNDGRCSMTGGNNAWYQWRSVGFWRYRAKLGTERGLRVWGSSNDVLYEPVIHTSLMHRRTKSGTSCHTTS